MAYPSKRLIGGKDVNLQPFAGTTVYRLQLTHFCLLKELHLLRRCDTHQENIKRITCKEKK